MTLIEILIVVGLLGIMAAVLVRSLAGTSEAGKQSAAKLFAQTTFKTLLMAYRTARGAWPQDTQALITAGFADANTFDSPWGGQKGYDFTIDTGNVKIAATYGGGNPVDYGTADGNNGCAFILAPSGKLEEKKYTTT
jgi:type II secretory pathway pseudopilin PulG